MSRSGLPERVFVELGYPQGYPLAGEPAVIGTEAIYWIDGRYGLDRIRAEMEYTYREYLANGFTLLGYVIPGDRNWKIHKI